MDTPTINKLRELRDSIRDEVKGIKIADHSSTNYGSEKEYTIRGIIAGINSLMLDVSALCKNSSTLIKITTAAERTNLVTLLAELLANIKTNNIELVAASTDKLKVLLRPYHIRSSSAREEEFVGYIDELMKKSIQVAQEIENLNVSTELLKSSNATSEETLESLNEKVEEVAATNQELTDKVNETEKLRLSIVTMIEDDEDKSKEIEELLTESKSHKELIESFSKRVSAREDQLDKQQAATDEYHKTLTQYKEAQTAILTEAACLIESAKLALQYKTAEGLSAAFAKKHEDATNDKSTEAWILRATLFLIAAVLVGIWLFVDKTINLEVVVGRLSLIPILIAGAWFCAGQYVKQKNISEDYAYKSVLAKSIVGFSDQLSSESRKGDDYSHYVRSVLAEIHKDPLRCRTENNKSAIKSSDIKEILKDLAEIRKFPDKLDKIMGNTER